MGTVFWARFTKSPNVGSVSFWLTSNIDRSSSDAVLDKRHQAFWWLGVVGLTLTKALTAEASISS